MAYDSKRAKELAEMFNVMDPASRERLFANVARESPDLASELQKQMFVFSDIAKLADKQVRALLQGIPLPQLALALRNAADELKTRFLETCLHELRACSRRNRVTRQTAPLRC